MTPGELIEHALLAAMEEPAPLTEQDVLARAHANGASPPPRMRVIGLTGKAGCGKDTAAEFILLAAMRRDQKAIRQGFADKLKLSFARMFKPEADLKWALDFCNTLKVGGTITAADPTGVAQITGREALQRYGTECHRGVFGEDFWLDAVLPPGRNDCDILVIPDVRFENEAMRVLDRGGEVWQIERPDTEAVEAHASEAGIPEALISRIVHNTGTLEALDFKVRRAL